MCWLPVCGKHKEGYTEIPAVHKIDNKAFLINPMYQATARQKGLTHS